MKIRFVLTALIIILIPFIVGIPLYLTRDIGGAPAAAQLETDTRNSKDGVVYKGIKIDWTFYSNWKYKPLLFPAEEYLVFVFHYGNENDSEVYLMPAYNMVSPGNRAYSANEEIAMYIEDAVENAIKVESQTPMAFKIISGETKHYIAVFEKPSLLNRFYIDVDVFRDVTLRISYKREKSTWEKTGSKFVKKYVGRG